MIKEAPKNMSNKEYQLEVQRTVRFDLEKEERIKSFIMGLAGETGKVIELIKKYFYHDQKLDMIALIDELGDLLWYFTNILNEFELELSEIQIKNINKLYKRYPKGFEAGRR